MEEVGFARAGDAWRWRGRRPERPDRRPTRSHAFAELAKQADTKRFMAPERASREAHEKEIEQQIQPPLPKQ